MHNDKFLLNTRYGVPRMPEEERRKVSRTLHIYGIDSAIDMAYRLGLFKGLEELSKIKNFFVVDRIVVNGRATIVFWHDGDKTIVKAEPGTKPDIYTGFTAAVTKRVIGPNTRIKRILKDKVEIQKPREKKKDKPAETKEKPAAKVKPTEKKRPIDIGKVMALHKAGWSQAKIADEMGCSQPTIGKIIKSEGRK